MDIEKQLAALRELRQHLPPNPVDVEKCLRVIAQVRAWIPERDRPPVPLTPREDGRLPFTPISPSEFDCAVILEEIESLVAELRFADVVSLMRAVRVYWSIADDPVQTEEYKAEIENLKEKYRQVFGKPLPKHPPKK